MAGALSLYAHWRLGDDGYPIRDGVSAGAFPPVVDFIPKVLEYFPDVYGFEDGQIVVRAVNGIAQYRPIGARRDADGRGPVTIIAALAALTMISEAAR